MANTKVKAEQLEAAQTNITSLGTLTALTVDDITIDGSTISDGGDLTFDVTGNLILDADGGEFKFRDGGTDFARIFQSGGNFYLNVPTQDTDLIIQGNDGGSNVSALTFDMSDAGAATFNADVTAIGIKAIESVNGDPVLGHFYNANSGNAAESTVYITNSSTVSDGLFLQAYGASATTAGGFVQDSATLGSGTGASGGLSIMTRAAADMRFYTNGHTNERMRIDSSGKVGIGNVTPLMKLHVKGATGDAPSNDSNPPANGLAIFDSGGGYSLVIGTDDSNTGSAWIQSQSANVSSSEYDLLLNPNGGDVGIGTTNPKRMLQVGDNTQAIAALSLQTTTSGLSRIYMGDNDSTSAEYTGLISYAHSDDSMQFFTGGSERMRITNAGYITNPQLPSFHARLSYASGVDASSAIHVYYGNNSISHNTGSHYKTSGSDAYMFVAPVAGKYYFQASLRVDAFSGNYSYLTLWKINTARSGSNIYSRDLSAATYAYQNHNVQAVIDMSANEAVWVQYQNNGDSSVNLDSDSWFSGYLIG